MTPEEIRTRISELKETIKQGYIEIARLQITCNHPQVIDMDNALVCTYCNAMFPVNQYKA